MSPERRCPVCQARFRGTRLCSRCGADLGPLMALLCRAHRLRGEARRALLEDRPGSALDRARAAEALVASGSGRRLAALARWVEAAERRERGPGIGGSDH